MIEMQGAGRSIVGCCHREKGWVSVALPVQFVGEMRVLAVDSDGEPQQCGDGW